MTLFVQRKTNMSSHEKKALTVDRFITFGIVLLLFVPFPFARFEACPTGEVISEHMIMPWSGFKLCYISYPDGDPVEDRYQFTWKGEVLPRGSLPKPMLIHIDSLEPPIFKWQNNPDVFLRTVFYRGEMIRLKTFWQPIVFWPLKMVLGTGSQLKDYPGKPEGRISQDDKK